MRQQEWLDGVREVRRQRAEEAGRMRARPLAPDDRREAILDAVLPLLKERGNAVTSRELAEAAGVAEGTLFRAFGDKESILQAGVARLLDPEPFRAELRRVPLDLALEDKLTAIIELLRARFREVFAVMTTFQVQGPPPRPDNSREGFVEIIDELLAPERDRLAVPTDVVAYYLRLVAFGSSIEPFNAPRPFDGAELAGLVVHGIAVTGAPPPRPTPRPTTRTSAGARATTSPPAAA